MTFEGRIHYGLFDDFAGRDSIVFAGDRENIQRFAAVLRRLCAEATGFRLPLNDLTLFQPSRSTDVTIELAEGSESRVTEVQHSGDKSLVTWSLSRVGATDAAAAIDALVQHDGPGHQYLEKAGEIQIVMSVDEYEKSIFDKS